MIDPLPPLSLYVHLPWCVRKCPYCDFNSHALTGHLDERRYIDALLFDLQQSLPMSAGRPLETLFIGGGTPSLFSGPAIERLLRGITDTAPVREGAEVTLEANPGAAEAERFARYRAAGVNRLSIGVQSFNANCLKRLGRIHDPDEALSAITMAVEAGFDNINLDLMFGLPEQTVDQAVEDLRTALSTEPTHISCYQLTLEPGTSFFEEPPPLPDEDAVAGMQKMGREFLAAAGFGHYEVSAYARAGMRCHHNLNYWTFGDYLGIGAGAHSKLTRVGGLEVLRFEKKRAPAAYLSCPFDTATLSSCQPVPHADLILEFMMNALRLTDGFAPSLFEQRVGLPFRVLRPMLDQAIARGLLSVGKSSVRATPRGRDFLDELLLVFESKI